MATTGLFWQPYTTIRTVLAASDIFQAWVGADDAAGALGSIFMFETRSGLTSKTRYGVISPPDSDVGAELERVGAGVGLGAFDLSSAVCLGLLEQVTAYTQAAAESFLSSAGQILDDVLGDASLANVRQIKQVPFGKVSMRWEDGPLRGYQLYVDLVFTV